MLYLHPDKESRSSNIEVILQTHLKVFKRLQSRIYSEHSKTLSMLLTVLSVDVYILMDPSLLLPVPAVTSSRLRPSSPDFHGEQLSC